MSGHAEKLISYREMNGTDRLLLYDAKMEEYKNKGTQLYSKNKERV